jgi:hypothetical protein
MHPMKSDPQIHIHSPGLHLFLNLSLLLLFPCHVLLDENINKEYSPYDRAHYASGYYTFGPVVQTLF